MIDFKADALVDLPNETDVTCWLAAHEELVRHWENAHPARIGRPCSACMPLIRQEALLFARVERLGADGVTLALEGLR
jgi:hypothetical protein